MFGLSYLRIMNKLCIVYCFPFSADAASKSADTKSSVELLTTVNSVFVYYFYLFVFIILMRFSLFSVCHFNIYRTHKKYLIIVGLINE